MLFRAFKQEKKKEMCIFPCAYVYIYIPMSCMHMHVYIYTYIKT